MNRKMEHQIPVLALSVVMVYTAIATKVDLIPAVAMFLAGILAYSVVEKVTK